MHAFCIAIYSIHRYSRGTDIAGERYMFLTMLKINLMPYVCLYYQIMPYIQIYYHFLYKTVIRLCVKMYNISCINITL